MEPPLVERHVVEWCDRAIVVRKGVEGDIESPHARVPEGDMSVNIRDIQNVQEKESKHRGGIHEEGN